VGNSADSFAGYVVDSSVDRSADCSGDSLVGRFADNTEDMMPSPACMGLEIELAPIEDDMVSSEAQNGVAATLVVTVVVMKAVVPYLANRVERMPHSDQRSNVCSLLRPLAIAP